MQHRIYPVLVLLFAALFTVNTVPVRAAVNPSPALAGRVYYVSPSGSDSSAGTQSQPWKTISKAARTLTAGDIVYLRGGIYKEVASFDTSGTQSQPIQIIAYPGEVPIVDGDNYRLPSSWNCLISLKGKYIQISGVELRYSNYCGLGISGQYVQASNINSHHNKENGILAQGDYDVVENSFVWWNAMSNENGNKTRGTYATGLSAARHPNYVTLRGNTVYNNWGEGISTYEANGTIIEGNIVYDNWSANVYISDATNVLLQRNLIYNSDNSAVTVGSREGIMMGDERYNPASSNITIINNFVYGTYRNLHWWQGVQGGGMVNVLVANNTFVNSRAEAGMVIASGSHSNSRVLNNIVLQEGSLPVAVIGTKTGLTFSNNLWSKIPSSSVAGSGDVIGNPLLIRVGQTTAGQLTGSWFEIQSGSPARGKAKTINEVTEDYYANSRDFSSDIGGHEFGATSTRSTFTDVPTIHWAWQYIEALVQNGITSGCGSGRYCPGSVVTRDQMAVFLLRGINGGAYVPPPASGIVFGDVPSTQWAGAWIEQLTADGITSGCGGGNYCPATPVTRDQMAVFLLRAKYGSAYVPPAPTGVFADVPTTYWAAAWIEQLAAEGITTGCSTTPKQYCPATPVTRDQMAVFLVRTFNLLP